MFDSKGKIPKLISNSAASFYRLAGRYSLDGQVKISHVRSRYRMGGQIWIPLTSFVQVCIKIQSGRSSLDIPG